VRTYTRVVLPLLMPTMILIGILNFVSAAGATSSVILLASRDTRTLAIIALEMADADIGQREAAGAVSLLIMVMTLGVALAARTFGLRLGVRHNM
jgi:ABC-type Fe3+ transport system permease subunit